ncbi:MAG: hypothetical protein HY226_04090 [Candidatus Vogelbacteria bacterium]|nr:hypothetical protein [Candidatus Vogelbacteria bacterium]
MFGKKFNFTFLFLFLFLNTAHAYVASSTNYKIDSDIVSIGGTLSTSTNYDLQSSLSTMSEEAATSSSFSIKSGYLQMASPYIAVSAPGNVAMDKPIYTSGGGHSTGSTSWTVTTDSSGGYSLSIKASTDPALTSSNDKIQNLSTNNGVPVFNLNIGDGGEAFSFTPEGPDLTTTYLDDTASACGVVNGADTVDRCWDFIATTNKMIARRNSSNHPSGTTTTVKFRTDVGSLVPSKKAGTYSATITVTVLAL